MDKIIEELSKLSPFKVLFKWLGFSEETSVILSTVLFLILVSLIIFKIKRLYKRWKELQKKKAQFRSQVDYSKEKQARRYYIDTQYQNASPTREEEPGFTHKYISRSKLIPFLINTGFVEERNSDKFFLVLGDSGMGKTTFMINLFFAYHRLFARREFDLKFYRLSNSNTLENIKQIPVHEANNTILLLDALDEDSGIIPKTPEEDEEEVFRKRIDEIIDAVQNFREVVFTCRTQYFPGQENDPYELKVKRTDERGYYTFKKLYISPFTDGEVRLYLRKKYGWLPLQNYSRRKAARETVLKSRNLMVRPMLLNYIDYLIEDEKMYDSTYSIYETLIEKWLDRESEKRKGIYEKDKFKKSLKELSESITRHIYIKYQNFKDLSLSKAEMLEVSKSFNIDLRPEEVTGQSLLTSDGFGNWKFAHKSIFEFFLAKLLLTDSGLLRNYQSVALDMTQHFLEEIDFGFIKSEDLKALRTKEKKDHVIKDIIGSSFIAGYTEYILPLNLIRNFKSLHPGNFFRTITLEFKPIISQMCIKLKEIAEHMYSETLQQSFTKYKQNYVHIELARFEETLLVLGEIIEKRHQLKPQDGKSENSSYPVFLSSFLKEQEKICYLVAKSSRIEIAYLDIQKLNEMFSSDEIFSLNLREILAQGFVKLEWNFEEFEIEARREFHIFLIKEEVDMF